MTANIETPIRPQLKVFLQRNSPRKIFFLLVSTFLVFYALLIPLETSNADVLIYACRSMADQPVLRCAFLNENSSLNRICIPNYHLAHTVILWFFYRLVPEFARHSIWPAGFVSALAGSLVVGISFLIWLDFGIDKFKAFFMAVAAGLVPGIWYHSLIGEVYIMQLLAILLFAYAFMRGKTLLSIFAFLFANLVSPLSALAFPLVFFCHNRGNYFNRAMLVAALSAGLYFLIYYFIGSSILTIFRHVDSGQAAKSTFFNFAAFAGFVLLNFNFFLYHLIKGVQKAWNHQKKRFILLVIAMLPQLVLLFIDSQFFVELGSFQLPVFWALTFPLGLALAEMPFKKIIPALLGLIIVFIFIWFLPNKKAGQEKFQAGNWLEENAPASMKVIGDWGSGIFLSICRFDWNLQSVMNNYYDFDYPQNSELLKTGQDSLLISMSKKSPFRKLLSRLPLKDLHISEYSPERQITTGDVELLFENNSVRIYKWVSIK